jgi:hypothetical protein
VSALYWQDLDCTAESRAIECDRVIHRHHATERDACLDFLAYIETCNAQLQERGRTDPALHYRCIRGPGGILRGVVG